MIPLVRSWAVDWLASHDADACELVFEPGYRLSIGSAELEGLEAYREGTLGQLRDYPGLVITVHEVIASGELAAVRFTEHGSAVRRGGSLAAWRGIALHRRGDGGLIERSWAEEDYASRRRQLTGGVPDPIEPPATAPWDTAEQAADRDAEEVVRRWLDAGVAPGEGVVVDVSDAEPGTEAAASVDPNRMPPLELDVLFSSGRRVAFHGRAVAKDGVATGVAGLVAVDAHGIVSGRLVTDRAGAASARKRMGASD